MNKYTARLIWTIFWLVFFLLLGIADYAVSAIGNQYTLSKLLLWFQSKSAVCYFGFVFMMGFLTGHLLAPQDPLSSKYD